MRVVKSRSLLALLGLLGICSISVTLAEPPASPSTPAPAATPASAAASTPVTSANAAAAAKPEANAAADAAAAAEEKRLLADGYKPEMRNGTKVWCRREQELGSRLGGQKVCGTPQELKLVVQQNKDLVEKIQKTQHNPSGN
jgi:hypothetical protein